MYLLCILGRNNENYNFFSGNIYEGLYIYFKFQLGGGIIIRIDLNYSKLFSLVWIIVLGVVIVNVGNINIMIRKRVLLRK